MAGAASQDPVTIQPISQYYLLGEHMSVTSPICLKAITDVLLLLHVHVIKLGNWDRIGRTRSAGRKSPRGTWWRALAWALRRVHVNCVRTKKQVRLAGPDLLSGILGEASSRILEVQNTLRKKSREGRNAFRYIMKRIGSKHREVI